MTEQYFYAMNDEKELVLSQVIIEADHTQVKYHAEFLYHPSGDLLYYFESQNYMNENDQHTTEIFFEKEKPIQLHLYVDIIPEDKIQTEHRYKAQSVLEDAHYYKNKFYQKQVPEMEEILEKFR